MNETESVKELQAMNGADYTSKTERKTRIYVLSETNHTKKTVCVSEDITVIHKCIYNQKFFDPDRCDYPELEIWENGKLFDTANGRDALMVIAREIKGFSGDLELSAITNILINMSIDLDFTDYKENSEESIAIITAELEKLQKANSPLCMILDAIATDHVELLDSLISSNI